MDERQQGEVKGSRKSCIEKTRFPSLTLREAGRTNDKIDNRIETPTMLKKNTPTVHCTSLRRVASNTASIRLSVTLAALLDHVYGAAGTRPSMVPTTPLGRARHRRRTLKYDASDAAFDNRETFDIIFSVIPIAPQTPHAHHTPSIVRHAPCFSLLKHHTTQKQTPLNEQKHAHARGAPQK